MGTEDAKENLVIQVMKDTYSKMLFAHVVPRKGMMDEHGADQLMKDIDKLGYNRSF
jgi:hypothetical protein